MKTQMRKAQGGLPFGASLIIAIVLSLIGAAFIFNMGGQIFGVVKSVPTEGSEIVAIARDGGVCLQRPSSELYEDYIVDYDIDELTFTTGALQFPPDYFEGNSWFQGICELSNTEDLCEYDEWGIITGGGSLPSVSGQPCEWKDLGGGSFIV
ncbi:TPA: hypothetical protein H1011_00265, partial [archaeon]|nr:hypothetical protein [Candidatus Undinarchaeum marinum]